MKSRATSTLLDENLTCEFKRKVHSLSPSHVWKLSGFSIACEKQSYSHLNSRTWPESKRKPPCGFDAAFFKTVFRAVNPLTPVPPVTARDEPWPFFYFWRQNLWPNFASSILNFWRRKRSFQWCLVHSDWLIGTSNMPKNAQKVERKTRS